MVAIIRFQCHFSGFGVGTGVGHRLGRGTMRDCGSSARRDDGDWEKGTHSPRRAEWVDLNVLWK